MSPPKETRGRGEPSPEHENFTPGPQELEIHDRIHADILRAVIVATEGVRFQSETRPRDAKCLVENIVGTTEEMKNQKDAPGQGEHTWILRAYNEIAAIYGLLGMTQQEKETPENLLVKLEERRGHDDLETMSIIQGDALSVLGMGQPKGCSLAF